MDDEQASRVPPASFLLSREAALEQRRLLCMGKGTIAARAFRGIPQAAWTRVTPTREVAGSTRRLPAWS